MRALRRFVRRLTAWLKPGTTKSVCKPRSLSTSPWQTADNLLAGMSPAEARRQLGPGGRYLGGTLRHEPIHASVITVSVLALGPSAFLACLIPALRASRISPLEALRAE